MSESNAFEIVPFTADYYRAAYTIWEGSEGIGLSAADSKERIVAYLERNPGMSYVALSGGRVVGAVLGGHDGRRGYIHHLAVDTRNRRRGIGRALLARCEASLKEAGVEKCHIFVYAQNAAGRAFWLKAGWIHRTDIGVMSKIFAEA